MCKHYDSNASSISSLNKIIGKFLTDSDIEFESEYIL